MRRIVSVFLLSLFFLPLLPPTAALAAEQELRFQNTAGDVRGEAVLATLTATKNFDAAAGFGMAEVDLNNDGVEEWVVREDRDPACKATAACRFFILGLKKKEPVLLGEIYAGQIKILDQKMYGVRSLAVYNNPKDDFAYVRFNWKPELGQFSRN